MQPIICFRGPESNFPKVWSFCILGISQNSIVQRMGLTTTSSLNKADLNGLVEFIDAPYKFGYISQATVTKGGSGYTSTPTVTITGKGQNATATCTISNGQVTTVAITNSGYGYY